LLVDPSGKLIEQLGLDFNTGPFVFAGLCLLIASIVTHIFLRPDPLEISRQISPNGISTSPTGHEDLENVRSIRQIFSKPAVVLSVSSMAIGQIVMVLLMVITPLHMNQHQHDTRAISWVIMAHTVGMFGMSWINGMLIDRFGRRVMIVSGAMILVLACLLAPISSSVPMLAISLYFLGLGWNFCFVAGSSLLSKQLTAVERGRIQGIGEVIVALSAGIGSFISGFIFAEGEILAVSILGLVLTFTLLGVVFWSRISGRPTEILSVSQS